MSEAEEIAAHADTLAREGIVVIEDYMESEVCETIYQEVTEAAESGELDIAAGSDSYDDKVNWGNAVVNKRTGTDEGMWDIFNADELSADAATVKNNPMILDIINRAAEREYDVQNINIYWNWSVTNTRDFHADTYSGKFKAFVYLTDVPDKSYGPYIYLPKTHAPSIPKRKLSEYINKIRNTPTTDAVFYNESEALVCTAPKETLIISDQTGYHRGHPQEPERERMLLSLSYKPVS